MPWQVIALVVLAILFDFLNGVHDSSNIVATMIASRAFSPRFALGMAATASFLGPFIFGVAVATTIGSEIVDSEAININVVLAALISAIVWNILTWYLGIPSSSSHALIGGILGAVLVGAGVSAINKDGLIKVLVSLFLSPILGLTAGYLFTLLVFFLARGATPRINSFFKRSQLISATALAFSHGTNDAQKTMGLITLGLVLTGYLQSFVVPTWVMTVSATAIAVGTAMGGWRLIKTLGARFFKIKPVDGFCSQTTSAAVILGASLLGGPVSTTQVVSSSIMGVGAAERLNKVRWGVGGEIATAWLFTIPSTAVLAAVVYWVLARLTS
jgi:inorganic phosphate transporter, PiT family